MNKIQLEKVDFNLLIVLHTVLTEGSATRAAVRLNITQSAVSHALRRLRQLTGDPLFMRRGATLVATPFTKNLSGPLRGALHAIEGALNAAADFEPGSSSRRFVVGMDERLEVYALPGFVDRLLSEAPAIEISSVRIEPDAVVGQLSSGMLDAVITAGTFQRTDLYRQAVTRDELVVLARTGHPLVKGRRLSLEQYLAAEHIAVTPHPSQVSDEDVVLGRAGHVRRIRVHAQRYVAGVTIVARSDLLLTMPRQYADVVNAVAGNRVLPLPVETPPIEYYLYWHASVDADAGGRWLRESITRSFRARG